MGYTHYFECVEECPTEKWQLICNDFKQLLVTGLITKPLPIQYESDSSAPVEFSDTGIRFNGIGAMGHESMLLQNSPRGFNCCKTANKPYDAAVTALLILAYNHSPHSWDISSDGDTSDWQEGLELALKVRPDAIIPAGVVNYV